MSNKKKVKPYGLWPSQVTPKMPGDLLEFSDLAWSSDGCLLWRERSSNRASLQRWNPANKNISTLSGNFNIGGGIMYGGGSFTIQGERIVFVDKDSNQLYLITSQDPSPKRISNYLIKTASPRLSPIGNFFVFVHSGGINDVIKMQDIFQSIPVLEIISKHDFYNYLRWHPDGTQLAWISWDHPNMPWDRSYLYLANLDYSRFGLPNVILPIDTAEDYKGSILQPEFSPNGQYLAYISDRDGWWQIYLYNIENREHEQITYARADHGLPPWLQNQCSYGFSSDSQRIYFIRNQEGFASLWVVDLETSLESRISLDPKYTWMESLVVSPHDDRIALVASGGAKPPEIIIISPHKEKEVIQQASSFNLSSKLFSLPEAISWEYEQNKNAFGLFYKPTNPEYQGEGKPPLLIVVHSGPTRQKWAEFQPRTQYFTSRGYAVLEVNYRGSTGYGREYWEAIKSRWGIVDVIDVYSGALELSKRGWVDPDKIALLGSSSGGLTVLQLLVKHPGVFKAGISLYGVSNVKTLIKDPPKFEQHYIPWLIEHHSEENPGVYESRSPLFSADKIRDPIAIFQGGKDPIVPQDQAEQIVNALKENSIPHEYHLYPEEGHGFKKVENVQDFYRKSEEFLRKYVIEVY